MEPHATIARWSGNNLTVWDKTQWVVDPRPNSPPSSGCPPTSCASSRRTSAVVSAADCAADPHTVVAALAARETRRPVELVLTRKQQYAGTGFRPSYRYRPKLGSNRQGRLAAMAHEINAETSSYETFTGGGPAVRQTVCDWLSAGRFGVHRRPASWRAGLDTCGTSRSRRHRVLSPRTGPAALPAAAPRPCDNRARRHQQHRSLESAQGLPAGDDRRPAVPDLIRLLGDGPTGPGWEVDDKRCTCLCDHTHAHKGCSINFRVPSTGESVY